ncbi:MAG: asparagine synthase (glutamine-hydrolyzing) [Desulforegulaceae bacterium]|nr:asparagine synthase (glutamine-hydrolyzing) [Desulforegulaceae bacterium]
MCGICGIYNLDNNPVQKTQIEKMNSVMVHRGPDAGGILIDKNIGLGHRRLKIIDLETGDQPMQDKSGQISLVVNGEIYNYLELRKKLEKKGHTFLTKSDTETIIYSYLEYGEDFVKKLRGMFAIGLWDKKEQKLIITRDRVGKKPLYYYFDNKRLVFASELKSLLEINDIPKKIDYKALDAYFSYGYVPSPLSIIKNIKKLEPGQIGVFNLAGELKIKNYWDINFQTSSFNLSETDLIEKLTELFDEAVKIRLISDVPLGAFLSGGVDSSAVVASMAGFMDKPVKTSSIGFMEKEFNELSFASLVAKQYGTDHHESIVSADALDIINKMVWHLDEPFADSSSIPTWYVSKATRKNVIVALSGDGGDENFAGYTKRYSMVNLEDKIRKKIPDFLKKSFLPCFASIYPRIDSLPRPLRLKTFLTNISDSFENSYCRDMSFYFDSKTKDNLYSSKMKEKVKGFSSENVLLGYLNKCSKDMDAVSKAQYVDIKTYMTEDVLVKVDRMSMAHSLEVRSPILDHVFMEFAATIPLRLKLNGKESKYIFKKMNENRLPSEVLYRKKQGFSVPLSKWIKTDLKPVVEAALFSQNNGIEDFLDMDFLRKIYDNNLRGINDYSSQIWNVFMFALWKKEFGF